MIRDLYGSRAQTIINSLLAFDAFFEWYYPYKKSIPFLCPMPQREQRAFDNCCAAIDMHEMYERIGIRRHKSYLVHGAIFKSSRDILQVGDVWAASSSSLEKGGSSTTLGRGVLRAGVVLFGGRGAYGSGTKYHLCVCTGATAYEGQASLALSKVTCNVTHD